MSRNKIATKAVAEDLSGVTVTFEDDNTVSVLLSDLSDEIVTQLALHGLSQKLGDSYSGEANLAVAKGKAEAVAGRLAKGDWKAVRESSGGGRISDLAQALATVTGRTLEEAVAVIENMDKEKKSALRKHPAVNAETKRIALARAEASVTGTGGEDLASLIG
jgi:hypothetical protein